MKKVKVDTWMPFYVGNYLSKTSRLTTEQHGAYCLLLFDYWAKAKPPPDDDEVLASITKLPLDTWKTKHRRALKDFFDVKDGLWLHERVEHELATARTNREQKVGAGKASAVAAAEKRLKQREGNGSGNGASTTVATAGPTETATAAQRRGNPTPSPTPPSGGASAPPASESVGVSQRQPRSDFREESLLEPPVTAETWDAYCQAYVMRYAIAPVRNATVNGQLANFVKRLGARESPRVAAFYLTHNHRRYVDTKHPVNLMVQYAETLRTEWATQKPTTETEARHVDRAAATGNSFKELIEESERGSH